MHKKIYFIVPYPYQEAPSQRFRFEQYFDFLKQNGYEIEIYPFISHSTWKTLYGEGRIGKKVLGILMSFVRRFFLLFKIHNADFIFIHREASHIGPPIFEWVIAKVLRRKYVYDFDDAIWLPNYSETNAKFHRLKAYWKVNYCMKWAHQVTAGNQYLANYALKYNSKVQIIPTTIDTINHHNVMSNHDSSELIIGWTGTHTTMHYLDELIPILQKLEEKYTFTFMVISNQPEDYPLKSLKFVKWNKETEIEDLAKFNIGIMPLKKDVWSEGKCGFKGLQYMSLEIPTLMSPVGVNISIVQNGVNGYLVDSSEEWYATLEKLILNKSERIKIGKAGRERVVTAYSVLANQQNYLELFQ